MRTLGVDLAAQPRKTAACLLRWDRTSALVEELDVGVDDQRLLELADRSEKVGLDVPFGWPDSFVAAVQAHAQFRPWPGATSEDLRLRRTDLYVRDWTGKSPLSVSADRIAVPAFRAARLLSEQGADRVGGGKFVEVYPRAARDSFGITRAFDDLRSRTPWLELDEEAALKCVHIDHCLDALVAALVARASALGLCGPIPEDDRDAATREGWIALPLPGSLERLL